MKTTFVSTNRNSLTAVPIMSEAIVIRLLSYSITVALTRFTVLRATLFAVGLRAVVFLFTGCCGVIRSSKFQLRLSATGTFTSVVSDSTSGAGVWAILRRLVFFPRQWCGMKP